jgi:hypothetical protein
MRRTLTVISLLAFAAACDRTVDPLGPEDDIRGPSHSTSSVSQDPAPDQMTVAQAVPGFGGYFIDSDGMPAVYLTDASQRPAAEAALAGFLEDRGFAAADLRVLAADYSWQELDAWYRASWPQALAATGAVFSDIDESANRLRFGGVDASALASIAGAVTGAGVPSQAVVLEQASPVYQLASLQDRIRPVQGGLQINFFALDASPLSYLCTLGFNAYSGGAASFVTNSHCSNVQGGSETPTTYYQALRRYGSATGGFSTFPGTEEDNVIGHEVHDPHYWTGLDCPVPGFTCRYSDAARAEYAPGVEFDFGRIARPEARAGQEAGTLEIDAKKSSFRIVGKQMNSVMGEPANKVGRTSGWTGGNVIGTCVNSIVLGSATPIIQLCQTRVDAWADSGDSGSPVFGGRNVSNGRVTLLGILWGGSSDNLTFVYSPMGNVERELGELRVH